MTDRTQSMQGWAAVVLRPGGRTVLQGSDRIAIRSGVTRNMQDAARWDDHCDITAKLYSPVVLPVSAGMADALLARTPDVQAYFVRTPEMTWKVEFNDTP